jgi:hypothetical protein
VLAFRPVNDVHNNHAFRLTHPGICNLESELLITFIITQRYEYDIRISISV